MATYKGREGSAHVGAAAGTAVSIGELRSFELTIGTNTTDASRMGDGWTREESTQNKWTASLELFYDPADAGQIAAVAVGSRITVHLFPQGRTAGSDVVYSGTATVTEVGHKQAHNGLVERTISLAGYGAITEATV